MYECLKQFAWRDRRWEVGQEYDPAGLPEMLTRDLEVIGNIRKKAAEPVRDAPAAESPPAESPPAESGDSEVGDSSQPHRRRRG